VPLGGSYLELVAVADEQIACASIFGRRVASAAPEAAIEQIEVARDPRDLADGSVRTRCPSTSGPAAQARCE
jgi:hypothetical protein